MDLPRRLNLLRRVEEYSNMPPPFNGGGICNNYGHWLSCYPGIDPVSWLSSFRAERPSRHPPPDRHHDPSRRSSFPTLRAGCQGRRRRRGGCHQGRQ